MTQKLEQKNRDDDANAEGNPKATVRTVNLWMLLFILFCLITLLYLAIVNSGVSEISYSYFQNLIEGKDHEGEQLLDDAGEVIESNIQFVRLRNRVATGTFKVEPPPEPIYDAKGDIKKQDKVTKLKRKFTVVIPPPESPSRGELEGLLTQNKVQWTNYTDTDWTPYFILAVLLVSVALAVYLFWSMRRAQNQMLGGGGFLSGFSRSPAQKYDPNSEPVTFDNVAGLEGVKADLQEIVEFLRDPEKFQKLGGRVPKGVLLVGPPGTGKTLLARAVAGEAEVPFYSVNGAEFIQMFVGVGASRVRDLFATAKNSAPSIIFIDEIDAVGRQRGAGLGGGHDEREQTLNQILGEMDGFQANESVIVVAATNRPDVLDPALLRPGRFDRHVTVSRPTKRGRLEIFKVHVRNVPLAADVDLATMASATVGMTGADIQNLVNEAALWAARHDKTKVEMSDFYYAHDKVLMGARRDELLTEKEKRRTAYHEAGHTITSWFLKGAYPVHKVTIIPRGQALGVTQMMPDEDRMNVAEGELRDQLVVLMGGRAAEKLIFDDMTVGAENDLERATSLARRMVTHWGMSDRLGPVSLKMTDDDPFLGREMHQGRTFSEHTMEIIDEEVNKILQDAAQKAYNMLADYRRELDLLTDNLIEHEELDRGEIRDLIGPSPHDDSNDHVKLTVEIQPVDGNKSDILPKVES